MKYYMTFVRLGLVLGLSACASNNKTASAPAPQTANQNASAPTAAATTALSSQAVSNSTNSSLSCSNGKDTRALQIIKTEKGCKLSYTKLGKSNEVASSTKGLQHCEKSKERIRVRLEKAGFQCS